MKLWLALVLGSSCFGVFGETLKMKDEPQKSRISFKHLNRIAVKNDRIASVSGLDEAFHFEKNEKTGEGYLKPTAENGYETLSVGATTVSGKTQDLILTVDDGDPNVLILENPDAPTNFGEEQNSKNSESSDFETSVIDAMKILIIGQNLQTLELERKPERIVAGFKAELVESCQIGGFVGCKYKVSTEIDAEFSLNESAFAKEGDIALSFSRLKISRNNPVFLYALRNFESRS